MKIRYKIQVTRRIRVQTRVRYSVRVLTTARQVVSFARERRGISTEDAQEDMIAQARAMLPPGTADEEIRDAIDAVCEEVDGDQ
jgi:hypothetical protein